MIKPMKTGVSVDIKLETQINKELNPFFTYLTSANPFFEASRTPFPFEIAKSLIQEGLEIRTRVFANCIACNANRFDEKNLSETLLTNKNFYFCDPCRRELRGIEKKDIYNTSAEITDLFASIYIKKVLKPVRKEKVQVLISKKKIPVTVDK